MKHISFLLLLVGMLVVHQSVQAQQLTAEFPAAYGTGHGNTRNWVDVDGDGKDDFCTLYGNRDRLLCWRSEGNRFASTPFLDVGIGHPVGNDGRDDPKMRWVDMNGDGNVDLCRTVGGPPSFVGFVLGYFVCNHGPTFATTNIQTTLTYNFVGYEQSSESSSTIIPPSNGVVLDTLHTADINEDGKADLCYQYADYGGSTTLNSTPTYSIRCRMNAITAFGGETIIIASYRDDDPNRTHSKAGFYDFNGDGRADFCNKYGCHVRRTDGFTQFVSYESTADNWPTGDRFGWEGSTFIDFNGDGKIDFCGPTTLGRLICLLSNGKDGNRTAVFSGAIGQDEKYWRWWADINGDGYPDYCSAVGPNIDGKPGWYDDWGTMRCRLGLGDSFAPTDINVPSFNFGGPDGGRAFCDPVGNGLQTFCRASKWAIPQPEVCTTEPYNGTVTCTIPTITMHGLRAGFSSDPQAEYPLLKKYSDGLGAETRLTYLPLTDDRVYRRTNLGPSAPELSIVRPRQMVVSETRVWLKQTGVDEKQWKPLTGNANYFYKDLLVHFEDGSRGFKERFAFQEGNNTLEHTEYFQGPGAGAGRAERLERMGEVGLTKVSARYAVQGSFLSSTGLVGGLAKPSASARTVSVNKVFSAAAYTSPPPPTRIPDQPFGLLQRGVNTLGKVTRPGLLPIVYVRETTATAWDLNGAVMPSNYSLTELDDYGNVKSLTQNTTLNGQPWSKVTTNTYNDDVSKWLLGRLTNAKVVSTAPTAQQQLDALPRSHGNAPHATAMSPPTPVPTAPQPISPAVLSAILQLLLED